MGKYQKEKIAYALSDNDRAGYYDDDLLAGLFLDYPEFDWGNYAVDVAPPKPLDLFLHEDVSQDEVPGVPDGKPKSKFGEIYLLGRVCYMMEIDPVYCDVIRMRYGKLTGSADLWEDEKYEL